MARYNAGAQKLTNIEFRFGDWFKPVAGERYTMIVSNPPYVTDQEWMLNHFELGHEPAGALFADDEGLAVLRRLVAGAAGHLDPGGMLAVEIAPGQAQQVQEACGAAGLREITLRRDLAGRERVVSAREGGED